MDTTNQNLKPLVGFANWAYDIREVAPGFEQVSLYRDNISRFVAPVDVAHEKLLANLKNIASEMEFDIQRKLSQRLYGFDFVAQSNDVFADVANVNIRRFLAGHAVSLKELGVLDCGVRSEDIPEFLDIIDGNGKQVLRIVSYFENKLRDMTVCGEKWRLDDMRTPTESSRRRNMSMVRGFFEDILSGEERQSIYSFVIDSRAGSSEKAENGQGIPTV